MVITSAGDSTNTLVSLDQFGGSSGLKRVGSYAEFLCSGQQDLATETQIRLPGEQDDLYYMDQEQEDCFLYLPADETSIDESLQYVPALQDAHDDLLNRGILQLSKEQRFLYVAQGEIAHCKPSQNHFLVSDRATTCHILALRSCSSTNQQEALCTLTHIDGTGYSECLRAAIEKHAVYHADSGLCQMDVHVVGGYKDLTGTSSGLSNWLFHEMAALASDYSDSIEFTLQTACITAMNTCPNSSNQQPVVRGLALDCRTGQVWMAHCPSTEQQGPAPVRRSARLWVPHAHPTLHCIFSHENNELEVHPYNIVQFKGLESLLRLPDHVLLQYCSTSPDVEEPDFCPGVRRSLNFLKENANTTLEPLRFRRCGQTLEWVAACQ